MKSGHWGYVLDPNCGGNCRLCLCFCHSPLAGMFRRTLAMQAFNSRSNHFGKLASQSSHYGPNIFGSCRGNLVAGLYKRSVE